MAGAPECPPGRGARFGRYDAARMLGLDDLKSRWLHPASEEEFSLPAIVNFRGMVQAAWDATGIQNFICPPSGMATPAGLLYSRDGDRIRRHPRATGFRWRAYEIERQAPGVASATRMPEGADAVIQRVRFERAGTYFLVFGGLPRVWRFTDYWNLPPEDVPQLNVQATDRGFHIDDTKTFGRLEVVVPGRRSVHADLDAWRDGAGGGGVEDGSGRGRIGVAGIEAAAGEEIVWHAVQGCEESLPEIDPAAGWESARRHWERTWSAAFTPGNAEFGGSLPELPGAFERLYAMSVLSLLLCRRFVPRPTRRSLIATGGQCIWNAVGAAPLERAYVWGGPEGGMTTSFLWELEFQAPLLARLDPGVLRAQLEALMRVGLMDHWGVETVSGAGAGMGYGVNAGAFLSCVADYVQGTGDRAWALARADFLRFLCRPGLTDCGRYENVLECVSTYEHAVASINALNVQGLRFVAGLTGDSGLARAADALARDVIGLYAGGPFACLQPDGSRRVVRTILDFAYVGRCLAADLPADVRRGMVAFFERELRTGDWCRALAADDPDALTPHLPSFQRYRADHQATGSYDGWPARAASALLRLGERDLALRWLHRIQELTHEGPFGQAHILTPSGARKASFFNGNCHLGGSGSGFASTLLELANLDRGQPRRRA